MEEKALQARLLLTDLTRQVILEGYGLPAELWMYNNPSFTNTRKALNDVFTKWRKKA